MRTLIERLAQAEGPDRKLDVEIGCVVDNLNVGHFRAAIDDVQSAIDQIGVPGSGWTPHEDTWPRYTGSIDAALTLVPKGYTRFVDATAPEHGITVDLLSPKQIGPRGDALGDHLSEPIATCIAVLKALGQK